MSLARRSRLTKLLALLAGFAVAVGLGEIVCRIDPLFPGKIYSAESMRGFLQGRAAATNYGDLANFAPSGPGIDPNDHRPVPDPWSGWTSPFHVRMVSRGTRWFQGTTHGNVFDVVLLGGSFGAQLGNVVTTRIPEWLTAVPEVAGRPVRVWNLSVAAQKQPSHLHRLTGVLALGWKPDLVVCVDGYNELALAAENVPTGVHPVYPTNAFWGGMARAGDIEMRSLDLLVDMRTAQRRVADRANAGLRFGIWRSALLSRGWSAWMSRSQKDLAAAREHYLSWMGAGRGQIAITGPVPSLSGDAYETPGAVEPAGVIEGVTAWVDAARNMRAICDARALPLVHAIQPGLDDAGSKPATDEEKRTSRFGQRWSAAIRVGYPLLRGRVEDLAREGVLVRDGSLLFIDTPETIYTDGCHLNDHGYEVFAAQVERWVAACLAGQRTDSER